MREGNWATFRQAPGVSPLLRGCYVQYLGRSLTADHLAHVVLILWGNVAEYNVKFSQLAALEPDDQAAALYVIEHKEQFPALTRAGNEAEAERVAFLALAKQYGLRGVAHAVRYLTDKPRDQRDLGSKANAKLNAGYDKTLAAFDRLRAAQAEVGLVPGGVTV